MKGVVCRMLCIMSRVGCRVYGIGCRAHREPGCSELRPAVQIKQAVNTRQLTAHQPLPFHHGNRIPGMKVINGCHHGHSWRQGKRERVRREERGRQSEKEKSDIQRKIRK